MWASKGANLAPPPIPAGEGQHYQQLPGFNTTVPGYPAGLANSTLVPPVWAVHELLQCSFIHFLSLVFFLYLRVPAALLSLSPWSPKDSHLPPWLSGLELILVGLYSLGTSQMLNFPVKSLCQVHTVALAQLLSGEAHPPLPQGGGSRVSLMWFMPTPALTQPCCSPDVPASRMAAGSSWRAPFPSTIRAQTSKQL